MFIYLSNKTIIEQPKNGMLLNTLRRMQNANAMSYNYKANLCTYLLERK